jgi:hypothetical protein
MPNTDIAWQLWLFQLQISSIHGASFVSGFANSSIWWLPYTRK